MFFRKTIMQCFLDPILYHQWVLAALRAPALRAPVFLGSLKRGRGHTPPPPLLLYLVISVSMPVSWRKREGWECKCVCLRAHHSYREPLKQEVKWPALDTSLILFTWKCLTKSFWLSAEGCRVCSFFLPPSVTWELLLLLLDFFLWTSCCFPAIDSPRIIAYEADILEQSIFKMQTSL